MDDLDGKEQESLVKQAIRQFMKTQLNELQDDKQENDNSFVFLEKSTLNMVLTYLFMNGERRNKGEVNEDSHVKILEELEQVIADNKEDFEEIITLLKERM